MQTEWAGYQYWTHSTICVRECGCMYVGYYVTTHFLVFHGHCVPINLVCEALASLRYASHPVLTHVLSLLWVKKTYLTTVSVPASPYYNWIVCCAFMCNVSSLSVSLSLSVYLVFLNLIIEGGVLIWLPHNSPFGGLLQDILCDNKGPLYFIYFFSCISNFLDGWKKWDSDGIDRRGDGHSYLIIMHGWCYLIMNVWYPSGVYSALSLSHVVCRSLCAILWGLSTLT